MDALDLERDVIERDAKVVAGESEATVFERTPGLTFTRILSAEMDGKSLGKPNWAGLLIEMAKHVKAKGFRRRSGWLQNCKFRQRPKHMRKKDTGSILSSVYRSKANRRRMLGERSAAWQTNIESRSRSSFKWRENEKAQHPGCVGIIRAGS